MQAEWFGHFGDIDLNIENVVAVTKKAYENSLANPISLADERRYIFDLLKCIEKNKDRIISTLLNVQNSRVLILQEIPPKIRMLSLILIVILNLIFFELLKAFKIVSKKLLLSQKQLIIIP